MSSAASMIQRNIGRFMVEKHRVPPSITYSEEQSYIEDNIDLDKVDEMLRCKDLQI